MGGGGLMNNLKPYLAMISMQFGYAGMYIITMVSLKHGMNHYVLAVYRHAIATAVIAPFALFHERYIVLYTIFSLIYFLNRVMIIPTKFSKIKKNVSDSTKLNLINY